MSNARQERPKFGDDTDHFEAEAHMLLHMYSFGLGEETSLFENTAAYPRFANVVKGPRPAEPQAVSSLQPQGPAQPPPQARDPERVRYGRGLVHQRGQ